MEKKSQVESDTRDSKVKWRLTEGRNWSGAVKGGIKGIDQVLDLRKVPLLPLAQKDKGLMDKDLEKYETCISSPE